MAWLNHFWKFSCDFFVDFAALTLAVSPKPATTFSCACLSLRLNQCSLPTHCSVSASNLLTLKFAVEVWSDPQFSALPKAIHSSGEMRSELWRGGHLQGLIVGVCCGRRPVEAPRAHCFVVDNGELVVQLVAMGKTGVADALCLQVF